MSIAPTTALVYSGIVVYSTNPPLTPKTTEQQSAIVPMDFE